METIEYRTQDKSTWGDGPWQTELDELIYTEQETGYLCIIARCDLGHLCGYIAVPEGHPYFGKSFFEMRDIKVHGNVTLCAEINSSHPNAALFQGLWIIGFDCGHAWDISPAGDAVMGELNFMFDIAAPMGIPKQYRNISYVKSEIEFLAKQLKALETQ